MRWILSLILLVSSLQALAGQTTEYFLRNGLKLIVREDHRAPVVVSTLWYKVGSSYEQNGETGVSHMVEHLMFKGSRKFKPGELDKIIIENGGLQNAMTSSDFTMYYEQLPADKLKLVLQLEADRMRGLVFRQDLYRKEHEVVMEERRMRVEDNPQGLLWERMKAIAFLNDPYQHPVIGWMSDIKHLTINDLRSWYNQWYRPNNAILIVVGDVKPNEVFNLTRKYFGSISCFELPKLKLRKEPPSKGLRTVSISLPSVKVPYLLLGYRVPTLKTGEDEWKVYALRMLLGVLNIGNSGRFTNDLIRGQQVAVDVGGQYDLYGLHEGLFILYGVPSAGTHISCLKNLILKELETMKNQLVSMAEINRVRAQMIAQNVYRRDSMMQQAFEMGLPEIAGLSWRRSDQYIHCISKVTPEQIRKVAKEFFNTQNLTVGVLTPKDFKKGAPEMSS